METVQAIQELPQPSRTTRRTLRVRHVATTLDVGVSSVWRMVKEDDQFPRPFKLSPRVTVWDSDELDSYIQKKAALRNTGGAE
jgi:prophage regulatory protein